MANRRCRLFHVDAFTRERFCGNPAVVVLDADELTEDQMQTVATEVNRETAFVLEAEAGDHDMQVKFFTPRHPVPFVGHATIAAQYVRAKTDAKPRGKIRQRTQAGIVDRSAWRRLITLSCRNSSQSRSSASSAGIVDTSVVFRLARLPRPSSQVHRPSCRGRAAPWRSPVRVRS